MTANHARPLAGANPSIPNATDPIGEAPPPNIGEHDSYRTHSGCCRLPDRPHLPFGHLEAASGRASCAAVLASPSELRDGRPLGLGRETPPERRKALRGRRRLRRLHVAGMGGIRWRPQPLSARLPRTADGASPCRQVRPRAPWQLGLPAPASVDLLATREVTT